MAQPRSGTGEALSCVGETLQPGARQALRPHVYFLLWDPVGRSPGLFGPHFLLSQLEVMRVH